MKIHRIAHLCSFAANISSFLAHACMEKHLISAFVLLTLMQAITADYSGGGSSTTNKDRRSLYDSGEHYTAGASVTLPFPGGDKKGSDSIFNDGVRAGLSFGQLTYMSGDVIGPFKPSKIVCNLNIYEERKAAARHVRELFNDDWLGSTERLNRAQKGMLKEIQAANDVPDTDTFKKHVAVHSTSYAEMSSIDDMSYELALFNCGGVLEGNDKTAACMLAYNLDHFGLCAKKTYQIFHDLALETAALRGNNLNLAYFYEGLGSHSFTDLFSAGHVRTPSKALRFTGWCSESAGGMCTNHMHDEDSYNGLYMTNKNNSPPWWVYGDSFYFEKFASDNVEMMHLALQESINEVYAAHLSKNRGSGYSGKIDDFPGKGLNYVPDMESSIANIPDFWDINTCPLWYHEGKNDDKRVYQRYPMFRLRNKEGQSSKYNQPSKTKFGIYENSFPTTEDLAHYFSIHGQPDLTIGGCHYKERGCNLLRDYWDAEGMFYSPEAGGFLTPEHATCQAYSMKSAFDNDCYDVLEIVSKGQSCDDIQDETMCKLLTPRCTWSGIYPFSGCSQGSCVAFSEQAGDIVPGDPTPPAPLAPVGFHISFQGACAFNSLQSNADYKEMPGTNDINTCGYLCRQYSGIEGSCTGIAVGKKEGSDNFDHCYLYFNNACDRADGPGFDRCATNELQVFHRDDQGATMPEHIVANCKCANDWFYKDPFTRYSGCEAVEAESWGSWCYLGENSANCELGMYSTTQPDNKWRYCGKSTCEDFACPDYYKKRDTITCYDEVCNIEDCCESCERMNSPQTCADFGPQRLEVGSCIWQDYWFSADECVYERTCDTVDNQNTCSNRRDCVWDTRGILPDACRVATCEDHNREHCEYFQDACRWIDGKSSDYCVSKDLTCDDYSNISWSAEDCTDLGCFFWDGWFYNECAEDESCTVAQSKDACDNRQDVCTWEDGWTYDECVAKRCDHFTDESACESSALSTGSCYWYDGWFSDTCEEVTRRHTIEDSERDERRMQIENGLDGLHWQESAIDGLLANTDFRSILTAPLSSNGTDWGNELQLKVDILIAAVDSFEDKSTLSVTLLDGRLYSIKACDHGPSCWSKYSDAEWTFGVADPAWGEFMYLFKIVAGKISFDDNRVSEFGVPDFIVDEFRVDQQAWYGVSGWSEPYTCIVLHPDQAEICKSYTKANEDYSVSIEMLHNMASGDPTTKLPKAPKAPKDSPIKEPKNTKAPKNSKAPKSTKAMDPKQSKAN